MDPWNIGPLDKPLIWVFYGLSNFLGVLFDLILISSVAKTKTRDATDMFVASLAGGCAFMSLTCGLQCFVNLNAGRFAGGSAACTAEAVLHVSSILVEFFSVTAMSVAFSMQSRATSGLLIGRKITRKRAWQVIVAIWITCWLVTGLGSLVSPIYLVSAGTYCFFQFSSFNIAGWLVPCLVLALITMFTSHVLVLRHFKKLSRQIMEHKQGEGGGGIVLVNADPVQLNMGLAQFKFRSTWMILILLVGWGSAVPAVFVELVLRQTASPALTTSIGTGGVSFSWAVPLVFTLTAEDRKNAAIRVYGWLLIPFYGKKWWQAAWNVSTYVPAMSLRNRSNNKHASTRSHPTPRDTLSRSAVSSSTAASYCGGSTSSGSDTEPEVAPNTQEQQEQVTKNQHPPHAPIATIDVVTLISEQQPIQAAEQELAPCIRAVA